jgi:hypothetical protein
MKPERTRWSRVRRVLVGLSALVFGVAITTIVLLRTTVPITSVPRNLLVVEDVRPSEDGGVRVGPV